MFCKEIRIKQDPSNISICSLSILYNSKFILMAMSLETNAVVVTKVHCIGILMFIELFESKMQCNTLSYLPIQNIVTSTCCFDSNVKYKFCYTSRKHAYIILTPLNPTFI